MKKKTLTGCVVQIAPMETMERGGETFIVDPHTREMRPANPPPGAYLEISPDVEKLLRSQSNGIQQRKRQGAVR